MKTILFFIIAAAMGLVFYFIKNIRKAISEYIYLLELEQKGFNQDQETARIRWDIFGYTTVIILLALICLGCLIFINHIK